MNKSVCLTKGIIWPECKRKTNKTGSRKTKMLKRNYFCKLKRLSNVVVEDH